MDYSPQQKRRMAKSGKALPGGPGGQPDFPIGNATDLENAIRDVGRANNPDRAKAWIKTRARQLHRVDLLPADWK